MTATPARSGPRSPDAHLPPGPSPTTAVSADNVGQPVCLKAFNEVFLNAASDNP